GDHVLRAIGAVMTGNCRAEDVVCRYGGEEFAVLTPGVGAAGAAVVAERMRQKVEALPLDCAGHVVKVTCSAGVTDLEAIGLVDGPELLAGADRALYEAKLGGRNRVVVAAAGARPPMKA